MGAPSSQWIACSAAGNGGRGWPLNSVVRRHQMAAPFIPPDKPKSWVFGICAVLVALLIVAPLMFISHGLNLPMIYELLGMGFVACWVVFAASWLVFIIGLLSGKYRQLEPRAWRDQVW